MVKASKTLTVDLADPSSISAKLPEAEKLLEASQRDLERQRIEVERWEGLVAVMKALTTGAPAGASSLQPPSEMLDSGKVTGLSNMQSLVVEVVNRKVRKIRAKDVTEILRSEGHGISGDSVSNTLWYVAEKVDPPPIKRAGRGFYAPLAFEDGISPGEAAASVAAGAGIGALAAHMAKTALKGAGGG